MRRTGGIFLTVVTSLSFGAAGLARGAEAQGGSPASPQSRTALQSSSFDDPSNRAAQSVLLEAVQQVRTSLPANLLSDQLGGMRISVEDRRLDVYWKGFVPVQLLNLIRQIGETGIRVHIHPAKFSESALVALSRALIAEQTNNATHHDVRITSAGPRFDGSGLEVDVAGIGNRAATTWSSFPIVSVMDSGGSTFLTRLNDSAPFWGGSRIVYPTQSCTFGFGVTYRSDKNYMLTAGHCGATNSQVKNGSGANIGYVAANYFPGGSDTALVRVSSSGHGVYGGAWNEPTNVAKFVTGTRADVVGAFVCTSGSFSGSRCAIEIIALNRTETIGSTNIQGLSRGKRTDGTNAAGQGDSGGPVHQFDENSNILASGLISSGVTASEVPCTGFTAGGRKCYNIINWVPIAWALADYGATINKQ